MKKLFKLALVGTMVLAAAACQREQMGSSSTSDEGEVKEVTTQFVLNVASAPQTKMSADVVQQNHNFRGIQDVKLYVYKTGISNASTVTNPTDANTNKPYIVKTGDPNPQPTDDNVKEFDLGYFMSPSSISNAGTDNNDNSSNRVLQLSIPVGVDAVMLYGKAIKASGATDDAYGVTLDYNPHDASKKGTISSTPSKTQFHGMSILNDKQKQYDATGALMIYIINDILSTYVSADGSVTVGEKVFDHLPELSWAQLGHTYEINLGDDGRYDASDTGVEKMPSTSSTTYTYALEGLEEVLGKCYYLFTYIRPAETTSYTPGSVQWEEWIKDHRRLGEYRAGSSSSLKKIIIDFYKVISASAQAAPTNEKEANAQRLANQILFNAGLYIDTTTGEFKTKSTIETFLKGQNRWQTKFNGAHENLNGYPFEDYGIPEGAAQLAFTPQKGGVKEDDEFSYMDPNYPLVNPTMNSFHPRKYLYPAELWYYVNSPIRTNESDVTVADFPNGVSKWNDTNSWKAINEGNKTIKAWTPNGSVASATKAIAVTNNVNYGVALLKSEVSVSVSTLQDNRKEMTDETTNRFINVDDLHIALRGVLVGGVNPRMNWQFTRYYTQAGQPGSSAGIYDQDSQLVDEGDLSLFDGVIYDHATGDYEIGLSAITNYTLVFDNYVSDAPGTGQTVADMQNDVYVALEFVNNGDAFWGRDNLIPYKGVFYLVGKLSKPTAAQISSLATAWPSDHQIPPLYGIDGEDVPSGHFAGESKKVARVFIQDFVTKAKFTLGEESLKHAYYSVPDLRASQMSLGLSVDLDWTAGLTYNIDL